MVSGEAGTAASFQPKDIQAGIPGYGEEGGAAAGEGVSAGDEGDCGARDETFDRLRDRLTIGKGSRAQDEQDSLVLLAAGAGGCPGGGEGVP